MSFIGYKHFVDNTIEVLKIKFSKNRNFTFILSQFWHTLALRHTLKPISFIINNPKKVKIYC